MNEKDNFLEDDREPLLDMADTDPYYGVRDNINSQVERIKVKYEKFRDLVANSDTSSNVDFKELRRALGKDLRVVDKDLKGLKEGVGMIDKNRAKFPQISEDELDARKHFVESADSTISAVKEGMESSDVRRKLEDDESNYKRNRYDNATRSPTSNPLIEQENSRFIKDQRQQTRATVQQQDESLDVLGQSVDRLGQIARDVNQEVREQNVMLDGLERDIDEGQSQMNVVQEALSKLLRTKDGCQIWTIVALTLILILLIALVIWS